MAKDKYEALKKVLLNHLDTKGELTHTEILQIITEASNGPAPQAVIVLKTK